MSGQGWQVGRVKQRHHMCASRLMWHKICQVLQFDNGCTQVTLIFRYFFKVFVDYGKLITLIKEFWNQVDIRNVLKVEISTIAFWIFYAHVGWHLPLLHSFIHGYWI